MNVNSTIKVILAGIGGVLAYLFGPWDALIIGLVVLLTLDYVTGVTAGAIKGELSSKVGFFGLLRKLVILVIIAVAAIIDRIIPSTNGAIRAAVIMFYIMNESLSILENAGRIGIPLPKRLRKAIESLRTVDSD